MNSDTLCFKVENAENVYHLEYIKTPDSNIMGMPRLGTLFRKQYCGRFKIIDPKIDGIYVITDKRHYLYDCPDLIEVSLIEPNNPYQQRMMMNVDVICDCDISD